MQRGTVWDQLSINTEAENTTASGFTMQNYIIVGLKKSAKEKT